MRTTLLFRPLLLGLLVPGLLLAQHGVDLAWGASPVDPQHDPPTNYNIKRALATGGPYVQVGAVPVGTLTFADNASVGNPMAPGQKFFYIVTAQNNGGESAPSTEVSATIPVFLPNKPATPSATAH